MIRSFILSCLFLFVCGILSAQITIEDVYFTSGAEVGVEGCPDTLVIELNARVLNDTLLYNVLISGVADEDDYTIGLPDTLRFTHNDLRLFFPITYTSDGIIEGAESVRFNFVNTESSDFASFPFNIYDDMPLEIRFSADTIIDSLCLRNIVDLNVFGAGMYSWYTKDSTLLHQGDSLAYFPVSRDTIFVRGKIHSCVKDTFLVCPFYSEDLSLSLNHGDTVYICKGETVDLSARSGNGTVSWTSSVPNILSTNTGNSVTVDTDISSYVYAKLEGKNCTIYDTVYVRVDSLPEYEFLENIPVPDSPCTDTYCPGQLVTISMNTTDPTLYPDAVFDWTPKDGSIEKGEKNQNILIITQDTTYYVRTTTNNACKSKDSILIQVIDTTIQLSVSDDSICYANPEKSVQIEVLNADRLQDIEWTSPDIETLSCDDCPNPVATPNESGTFTYTIEALVDGCCPSSASVTIEVTTPQINIPDVFTCPGDPVEILVDETGLTDPEWIGNPPELDCRYCFDNVATVNNMATFALEALDEDNCINRGTASVIMYPATLDIIATTDPENEVAIGGTVLVEIDSTGINPDLNTFRYELNGEPIEGSGLVNEILILEEGENEITIIGIDDNGCEVRETIIVNGVAPEIEIPNAFSPNNDETNDVFRPVIVNAESANASISEFRVYNRWGELVYEMEEGANEEGWDGNYNGETAPPDVYLYQIIFQLPNGQTETHKGDVTLVR